MVVLEMPLASDVTLIASGHRTRLATDTQTLRQADKDVGAKLDEDEDEDVENEGKERETGRESVGGRGIEWLGK